MPGLRLTWKGSPGYMDSSEDRKGVFMEEEGERVLLLVLGVRAAERAYRDGVITEEQYEGYLDALSGAYQKMEKPEGG